MRIAPLIALFTLLAHSAAAQTVEQLGFFRLQDNSPLTARSASLGGVSDPLGTDFAVNPATSASLTKPMLIVQGQRQSNAITIYSVDANDTLHVGSHWLDGNQLTLVAAAVPVGHFVLGGYYASDPRLLGPESTASTSATAPYTPVECGPGCTMTLPLMNLVFDRAQKRYGITGAWERGNLAVGVGLELQRLDESSEIVRTAIELGPFPLVLQNERLFRRIDDSSVVPNAGIRWKASPRVALAAAYNGGGTFRRTTSACVVRMFAWDDCTSAVAPIGQGDLKTPDSYRAAVAFDVTPRVRAVAEAVRRNYSSLAVDEYSIKSERHAFPYHDVTETHAGVEVRLSPAIALRAGWWNDPRRLDSNLSVLGDSMQHYTAGIGIGLGHGMQLDAAYDRSEDPVARSLVAGITFR